MWYSIPYYLPIRICEAKYHANRVIQIRITFSIRGGRIDWDLICSFQVLENPWFVLPVEVLHGLTYAAMWTASLEHAHNIAPGAT